MIIAIDALSQKMALEKCVDKTAASWHEALKNLLEKSVDKCSLILSDRDVVVSKQFAKEIFELYRIKWGFLTRRSKAFLAERRFSLIRTQLTELMEANRTDNWTQYLETICLNYNDEYIKHTKFKRSQISDENYLDYLGALYKTSDASLFFNSYSMGKFSADMSKRLFRYSLGQRVRLARKVDIDVKKSIFDKPSMVGHFSEEEYTVKERTLKHDSKYMISPCYRLRETPGLFYESELLSV